MISLGVARIIPKKEIRTINGKQIDVARIIRTISTPEKGQKARPCWMILSHVNICLNHASEGFGI